jgi:hypothetical protein
MMRKKQKGLKRSGNNTERKKERLSLCSVTTGGEEAGDPGAASNKPHPLQSVVVAAYPAISAVL